MKYRRILLKLSGEALQGQSKFGIDQPTLAAIADELIDVHGLGVEIALVIGGGNIFRGGSAGMDRAHADYMGMLATVINSLALQDALESRGRTRACCRPSRWSGSPSRTSAGAPFVTWKKGGW